MLVFEDETTITQKPCIHKSMSFEGQQQRIEHNGSRNKFSTYISMLWPDKKLMYDFSDNKERRKKRDLREPSLLGYINTRNWRHSERNGFFTNRELSAKLSGVGFYDSFFKHLSEWDLRNN